MKEMDRNILSEQFISEFFEALKEYDEAIAKNADEEKIGQLKKRKDEITRKLRELLSHRDSDEI